MSAKRSPAAQLAIGDVTPAQYDDAVALLARGMRDNPIHVAAYGLDERRREWCHRRLVGALFRSAATNRPIGIWRNGTLVACTAVLLDHGCRPSGRAMARSVPALVGVGPLTALRVGAWMRAWRAHDPDAPHAHLGPLAVDRELQGQGFGTLLLAEHCRRLDEAALLGYLETDKAANVPFYERAGYAVVDEADVLGVPTWFMRRHPGAATDAMGRICLQRSART